MKKIIGALLLLSSLYAETTMLKDPATNLIWEDTYHVEETKLNYAQAATYCSELHLGGFEDWRIPTLKELMTIIDYNRYKPAIFREFRFVEKETLYWSNTRYVRNADEYWGVVFKDGSTSNASETYDRYVRCVKNAQ